MLQSKRSQYQKAYVELNEILKLIPKQQRAQIPDDVLQNLNMNMDKNYQFQIDTNKTIFEQDLMIETKALLIELYVRYLAPSEENAFWAKYNSICNNMIEEKKKQYYNPANIFQDNVVSINESVTENMALEIKKESIFSKILTKIKLFFKIN